MSSDSSPPRAPSSISNSLFRDKGDLEWTQPLGDRQHPGRAGEFEIEDGARGGDESLDIVVLDVSAIFAEVRGDSVRPRRLTGDGRGNRIGFVGSTRLTNGCDVVDVYIQALEGRRVVGHRGTPRFAAGRPERPPLLDGNWQVRFARILAWSIA